MYRFLAIVTAAAVFTFLSFSAAYCQNVSLSEIYRHRVEAAKAYDFETFSKYISKDVLSKIEGKVDSRIAIAMMNSAAPVEYTTGREIFDGQNATMEIKGKTKDILSGGVSKFSGTVYFKKEDGEWKIAKEYYKLEEQ